MSDKKKLVCISCSIFKSELKNLQSNGEIDFEIDYVNSMMHMCPQILKKYLDYKVENFVSEGIDVVLLYGECHNYMDKYDKMDRVEKVKGINCFEIMLGKEKLRSYLKDGAFFLLPEWAIRWKEVFKKELDLRGDSARMFMQEMHKYFLYLDSGIEPIPHKILEEISDEFGLPVRIEKISTEHLRNVILEAVKRLEH